MIDRERERDTERERERERERESGLHNGDGISVHGLDQQ